MSAMPSTVEAELRARFRQWGRDGTFASLGDPATLARGCERLRRLAYEADTLGIFLSVIATAGLALPILAHAESPLAERVRAGDAVAAVAITERGAGSDVLAMASTVTMGADGSLRLTGSKWHITNAPLADAIVVFAVDATTEDRFVTAVLVRPDDPGVRRGPALDLIGCHGSPTGELWFDDVRLPADRRLGGPTDGKALLDRAFLRERALAPWPLLGKMERVLGECLDHVERREQFQKPLHEFQYVQEKIVSGFDRMLHARHLAERAIADIAAGRPEPAIASLAKATAADAALHVFQAGIEVHGSYGVQADRRYGDFVQDALCAQIAGGTRETHKKVVFGALRLERARARKGRPSPLLRGENGRDR